MSYFFFYMKRVEIDGSPYHFDNRADNPIDGNLKLFITFNDTISRKFTFSYEYIRLLDRFI